MRHRRQILMFLIRTAALLSISIIPVFSAAQEKDIEMINSEVAKIDNAERNLNQNFLIFCRFYDKSELIQITDTLNWPDSDSIEFTYNITLDSNANIIQFIEMPRSESGDWFLDMFHYFDNNGHVLKFSYYLGQFASGCTEFLRDERDQFFTKEGQLIKESRVFTDGDYKAIDTTGCYIMEDFEYGIFKTVGELIAKQNLLKAFLKIDK
jgi:hypothetical protein